MQTRSHSQRRWRAFPQEIFNLIIDYHFDDRKTLQKCSLVCKAWVPACRRNLFCYVWLKTMADWAIFSTLLNSYTRVLMIGSLSSHRMVQWRGAAFPKVSHLQIYFDFDAPGPQCQLLRKVSPMFPRVTILEIWVEFETLYETVAFVCSFPELEILTLVYTSTYSSLGGGAVEHFRLPAGLHTLNLAWHAKDDYGFSMLDCSSEGFHFLKWLDASHHIPKLVTLRVFVLLPEHIAPLSSLLLKLGGSLQNLDIAFDEFR